MLLLADEMNKFRQTSMEHYKFDPAHFYTLPNLSLNVMLKMTNVNIELMRDIDMYNTISNGLEVDYVLLVLLYMLRQITHI